MAGACLVAVAQPAQAITPISVSSPILDTKYDLLVQWKGVSLDNGSYDAEFEIPGLVHWAIGDILESTPAGGGLWNFSFKDVRHVANPHDGEHDAPSVNPGFSLDYSGGFQSGTQFLKVLHPGTSPEDHPDRYWLTYEYGNPDPVGDRNSDLTVTLRGNHVPAPLPILGVGAVYSYSRRMRRRIADVKNA
jgi:hypothetical protein